MGGKTKTQVAKIYRLRYYLFIARILPLMQAAYATVCLGAGIKCLAWSEPLRPRCTKNEKELAVASYHSYRLINFTSKARRIVSLKKIEAIWPGRT